MSDGRQGLLPLDYRADPKRCEHRSQILSQAHIPAALVCASCWTILAQRWVHPEEPEQIGYVSADWAWHYRDGKPWTTREDNL